LHGEFERAATELEETLAAPAGEGAAPEWPAITILAATVADVARALMDEIGRVRGDDVDDVLFWAQALEHVVQGHCRDATRTPDEADVLNKRLQVLADSALQMAYAMEFGFLLDPVRNLLSIGYAVADGQLDPGNYDLLASEARLASFVAIAKGDVPARHWFRLGRLATPIGHGAALWRICARCARGAAAFPTPPEPPAKERQNSCPHPLHRPGAEANALHEASLVVRW